MTNHENLVSDAALVIPEPMRLGPRLAAQYVRMSTDHQQYSIVNQQDAITRYAAQNGLAIVRTYVDEGRSGLTVRGRSGLCDLLSDVMSGNPGFEMVLVYDVSRWGRFQDTDESAFYEFLCKKCGVSVVYCAEPFRNDSTPMASVMKGLKRVMAGEFSRELSEKVYWGKARLTRMGYSVGGGACYGLRRMLVDERGKPRCILQRGERKCLSTDRVVLVPGPVKEQRVVRWIFRQVAHHGKKFLEVADDLNRQGVPSPTGRPWTDVRVEFLLRNEKYIGNMVFARTSTKLKTKTVKNPPEQWVRKDGAFKPIVDPALYARAQRAISRWGTRINDEEALAALKEVLDRHGYLSQQLIDRTHGIPSSTYYSDRFGGLHRVYAKLGYRPRRKYDHIDGYGEWFRRAMALRCSVLEGLRSRGVQVEREGRTVLVLHGRVRVKVSLVRCRWVKGTARWHMLDWSRPDWTLMACESPKSIEVESYWLVGGGKIWTQVGARFQRRKARFRSDQLGPVLDLLADREASARALLNKQLPAIVFDGTQSPRRAETPATDHLRGFCKDLRLAQ